jgi:bifunctional non-homologous end joining protein LigD
VARSRKEKGEDRLSEYRRKRSAGGTPEPFAKGKADRPGLFVVHKHWASHMHFDLRLEMGGVLMSWAVPKGPSLNPDDKRLAMHVEDHPLEYGDFEGIIPEGNYGAGAVIVWDRGLWIPIEGQKHGMEHGKLLFDLKGYKLRGRWTIFKTKRGKNEWLLVKKPDGFADRDGSRKPGEESVFSGRTVEEVRQGKDPADRIRAALKRAKAPKGDVDPRKAGVMLAQQRDDAFSDPGWVFEIKYDGYRLLAARDGKQPLLRYRRGQEVTANFPEIAKTLEKFPYDRFLLDGEVVVLDEEGKPSFQRLQQRVQLKRPHDIARASVRLPATLFVFDLLAFEDRDLRSLPLLERKKILEKLLPRAGALRYSEHIPEAGEAMYEHVQKMRLEGLIAKRADSKYTPGRSADWLKIRVDHTGDFAVVGYSPPKRARTGFGALHVAFWESDGFVYAGRVGSGFSDQQLKEIPALLDEARVDSPQCTGPTPTGAGHVWVEPFLCAEVRYKEWTAEGMLRHPVFLRLREDKPLEDCAPPHGPTARVELAEPSGVVHDETAQIEAPNFTNLDKVFWPEEGYTKGDLIEYYRRVSEWLLPYLSDRPVVLTRYPDGIHGKNFFQKDAPGFVPDWVRTETMWSEHAEREIHYFIAEDERSLLYLGGAGDPRAVRRDRAAVLRQDERLERPPRAAAARRPVHLRPVEDARPPDRPHRLVGAAEDLHHRPLDRCPRGARLHRLPAERARQTPGVAALRAAAAGSAGLDAAQVVGGEREARDREVHDRDGAEAAQENEGGSGGRGVGRGAGSGGGVGAVGRESGVAHDVEPDANRGSSKARSATPSGSSAATNRTPFLARIMQAPASRSRSGRLRLRD